MIENAQRFADRVVSFKRDASPAQIQGYFMMNKLSDAETVVANVERIWDDSRRPMATSLAQPQLIEIGNNVWFDTAVL